MGSSKVYSTLSYRNEGNSTLVLSVNDTLDVVRIKKLKPKDNGKCTHKNYELEFFEKVIGKMLRVEFQPVFRLATDSELQTVLERYAATAPLCYDCVSLMPDYSQLQFANQSPFTTYSIELKPKQGWVAKIDRFANKCVFCRMQTMKITSGKVSRKTDYCPLDLFSGDRNRMFSAIDAVLRCPQNNFQVHGDNSPISDSLRSMLDELFPNDKLQYNRFCWFLVQLLANDLQKTIIEIKNVPHQKPSSSPYRKSCRYFYRTKLKPQSILNEILKNQQLISKWNDMPHSPSPGDHYAYVKGIRAPHHHHQQYLETIDEQTPTDHFANQSDDHFNFDNYLIGSVFNDCSILITFRKNNDMQHSKSDQFFVRFENGQQKTQLIVQMKIIDLGPKPITCVDHHRTRFENFENYHWQYFT